MFIFNAKADLNGKVFEDNRLVYNVDNDESLRLEFKFLEDINIEEINIVQKPIFEDLKKGVETILRT